MTQNKTGHDDRIGLQINVSKKKKKKKKLSTIQIVFKMQNKRNSTYTAFSTSAQPGIKPGARKNNKTIMLMNQNRTCHSCVVMGPNSSYFCRTTALTVSDAAVPFATSRPSLDLGRNRPKWVICKLRYSRMVSMITIGMAQAIKRGKSIGSVASGKRLCKGESANEVSNR